MKLKNFWQHARRCVIVVEYIEKSKKFYEDLFGLKLIKDNDGNMILTEKLALQQKAIRFYDLDGNLIEVGTPIN